MFRITRLADYGILLVSQLAGDRRAGVHTARDLAGATGVPLPTVSKILKALARSGLLVSHRGVGGGFALARDGHSITVADVLTAIEGPIALTDCLSATKDACAVEATCAVRLNWERINDAVRSALSQVTVAEMIVPRFGPARVPASGAALAVSPPSPSHATPIPVGAEPR